MPPGSGPHNSMQRRAFLIGWLPGFFHRKPLETLSGVEFRVIRYAHSPRRYLVIHGDEDTARDVLSTYMYDHDGVAYIVTGKTRNVAMQGLQIDPNRMFSREGAERSLHALNPNANPEQVIAVLNFLDKERGKLLKDLIPHKSSRLFAMHNNRDYSVQDEIAASDQTSIVLAVGRFLKAAPETT